MASQKVKQKVWLVSLRVLSFYLVWLFGMKFYLLLT